MRNKGGIGFQSLVQAEKLMQIAFVLPSAMIVGWLAGAWADTKLHQSWLTIVGIILGCISGLVVCDPTGNGCGERHRPAGYVRERRRRARRFEMTTQDTHPIAD